MYIIIKRIQSDTPKKVLTSSVAIKNPLRDFHTFAIYYYKHLIVMIVVYNLVNPRKLFISPAGQGFLPRETAWHHQNHVFGLIRTVNKYIYCPILDNDDLGTN
jgi:hypothetical protein